MEKNIVSSNKSLTLSHEKGKLIRIDQEVAEYLNINEVHQLLSVIENKTHYLLIDFLWKTGCRITEALSIIKDNIDFYNKTVKIRWLKRRKAKERYIPLHSSLAYELSILTSQLNNTDKVFPITRQRAFQIIKQYMTKSNILKNIHPHTLRHSFAIHFLNQTGNIAVLQQLLGHAQITTTMMYLKYVKRDTQQIVEGVEW